MKKSYSKILIIFLIIAVFSNFLILPKKTQAMTVTDLTNLPANIGGWVEQILTYVQEVMAYVQDKIGPMMRDTLAKKILDYIVDETIEWVQGGGEPKFVGDWQGFLEHAGDIAFDSLIKELGLSWLCSPFKLQVRLSVMPAQKFSQEVDCTLDDVVGNIENFYKDFENGGWIAYNEMWQPQNNYYGAVLMAYDEAILRINTQVRASEDEALSGGGYLSAKESTSDSDAGGDTRGQEQITTPGSTIGATVDRAVQTDTEWASNIESWLSALVNAAITRLTSQGIRDMVGSAETYSYYYPSEYEELMEEETQQQQQQLIDQVKEIVDEWKYLAGVKSNTIPIAEQLKAVLTQISAEGCYVAPGEIEGVQNDIDTLRAEIIDLNQNKIPEGEALIDELENAKTAEERTTASHHQNSFMNTYNTAELREDIIKTPPNIMGQNSADAKYSSIASALSTAQDRLDLCEGD